jgi:phytoene dehydrogenase-like protein
VTDYDYDVVIIGAGAAGLRAALELQSTPMDCLVLEKDHQVGGRVRSYRRDGFILDRGFQILLTAYPEVRNILDLDQLDPHPFMNGARIRTPEGIRTLMDPLSHPVAGIQSVIGGPGTLYDKWKIFTLRRSLKKTSEYSIFDRPETTTRKFLESYGFSRDVIEQFFRPFFSGVFLEDRLETSSRMFQFVYKMFAEGEPALPTGGIQAIPEQMASRLPDSTIETGTAVKTIDPPVVQLSGGETLWARTIVDATGAGGLVEGRDSWTEPSWNGTNCYYFKVKEPPCRDPVLHLNAAGGFINNLCFPSLVNDSYAPEDWHLLSVSTLRDPEETVGKIREELENWFGPQAKDWSLVGRYEVERALPSYTPDRSAEDPERFKVEDRLYRTGDVLTTPSLNGALKSGRIVGERIANRT